MKIRSIETFRITLPFRFSFGHSLASRSESTNLLVKITLSNGITGYGEGIPRDYVTGEDIESAESNVLTTYAPIFLSADIDSPTQLKKLLTDGFDELGLLAKPQGSSWCALELALLDAYGKLWQVNPAEIVSRQIRTPRIRYGGVIPFGGLKALSAVLWFYKFYGFKTIKLKVGKDLDTDMQKLAMCRKIMGDDVTIRVDANCAWSLDSALRASEAFTRFNVASYEQPLPADDWDGLQKLTASIAADVMVDESLCTVEQARQLAHDKVCSAFNIRISKAGGLLPAARILSVAQQYGIKVQMGAQVGETGILTAAGRYFACSSEPFLNYEGAANLFLLKQDLTTEDLTVRPGGYGDLAFARRKHGLGITVKDTRLLSFTQSEASASGREHVAAS